MGVCRAARSQLPASIFSYSWGLMGETELTKAKDGILSGNLLAFEILVESSFRENFCGVEIKDHERDKISFFIRILSYALFAQFLLM